MNQSHFIIKHKKLIITSTFIILLISIYPLSKARINSDLLSYYPDKLPAIVSHKQIEQVFGKADPIMIVFETDDILNENTLKRIKSLSKTFNRMNDFDRVISLFDTKNIKGEVGYMIVDPAIKRIPRTQQGYDKLRENITSNELAYKLVVSEDFRYTLIILNSVSEKEDDELMKTVINTLDDHPGHEKVYINGQPYLRAQAEKKIASDFIILLPVGLLVMAIFLWVSFREKRGVLLPTFVVITAIVISLALIPIFKWDLSVIGILIPIMMIAVANDYGIHVLAKYQELNARNPDMSIQDIVILTVKYLKKPVILTGITTIVGIAGLITHVLLPAKQMGIVSVVGIGFALMASLTFIPATMLFLKKGKPHKSFLPNSKKGWMDFLLKAAGKAVTQKPKQVVIFFSVFLAVAATGFTKLKLAADFDNILPKSHSYNISLRILNQHFSGTKNITLMFTGDIKDPALLKRMMAYENAIEEIPGVAAVNSIASMLKIMSRALNEPGDHLYDKIPDTRNAVAQYLELYAMNGDPTDLENLVDFEYQHATMQIQYFTKNLEESNQIIYQIKKIVGKDECFSNMGGMGLIENRLCNAIGQGLLSSLIFALLAILILLMIIFRSVKAGWMGSLPLLFSTIATFGIMGWLNIKIDIVTALLSSISIGLGVDYTIHIFWRIKNELQRNNAYDHSIMTSLQTTGRGITINAFSVIIGFSVLFISAFPIIHLFAFLIITSIFFCLISALVLIPALCMILHPKFLSNK